MAEPLKISACTPAMAAGLPSMRLVSPPPAPGDRGAKWIDLATAAKRSGLSSRSLQRLCAETFLAEGLARATQSRGGRPRWMVREDADERFAPVKFAAQLAFDAGKYREHERRIALDRRRILAQWEAAKQAGFARGLAEDQATLLFLSDFFDREKRSVCRQTLFRWQGRYRREGLAGLVDRRGARAIKVGADDPFLWEVKRLYLDLRKLKLTVCYEIAAMKADENGWEKRSIYQIRRAIDRLPHGMVLRHREGDEAYTNEAEPFIERDYSALRSNETWVGDHHQFDVMVNHAGRLLRPWLTAWMDMRSRKIVGWQILASDPNTDAILAAFGDGARACGVPEGVYVDNGKDYDSYALNGRTKQQRRRKVKVSIDEQIAGGVFASLDVTPTFCWAYHGQSKPIERFFGTVEQATPVWKTYCGKSPADRPEDHLRQLERGHAPSLPEFVEWFAAWLGTYHADAHTGDGMNGQSPDQVFAANLTEKRTAPADVINVLLMKSSRPVKVGQNGVRFNGLCYGQYDSLLIDRLGQEVTLRSDPKDVSYVLVWTIDGRFVCRAKANDRIPANATAEELKAAIAEKRQARRAVADYMEKRPRLHEDLPELLIRARAKSAAASAPHVPASPAPTIRQLQNPFKDSLPALQKALARGAKAARAADEPFDLLKAAEHFRDPAPEPATSLLLDLISMNEVCERNIAEQERERQRVPYGDLGRFAYLYPPGPKSETA